MRLKTKCTGAAVLLLLAMPVLAGDVPNWAYDELLAPWYEAFNAKDAAGIASQYTEDAVTANATGRAAIEAQFKEAWSKEDVQCHGDFDGFRQVGNRAIGWGTDTCTVTSKSAGETRTSRTEWFAQYERQADGTWLASSDFGQEVSYVDGFMPARGQWNVVEQHRDSPDSDWTDATSEWGILFKLGKPFVDTSGSREFADGNSVSWTEVWGVDPASGQPFTGFVDSTGATGQGTFKWAGRSWITQHNIAAADGRTMTMSCSLDFNDNHTEFDGACFTKADGQSWQSYKGKGSLKK